MKNLLLQNLNRSSLVVLLAMVLTMYQLKISAQEVRFTTVNPETDVLTITNFDSMAIDMENYWLCLGPGSYVQIGSIAPGGNAIVGSGEEIELPYTMDAIEDGLSLFSTNDFTSSDPNVILDFVQWGAPNQARADQAVTAGRWDDVNGFVIGSPPFNTFEGGSADAWTSTFGIDDNPLHIPLVNQTIGTHFKFNLLVLDIFSEVEVFNSLGKRIETISLRTRGSWNAEILSEGIYYLRFSSHEGRKAVQKIIVKK